MLNCYAEFYSCFGHVPTPPSGVSHPGRANRAAYVRRGAPACIAAIWKASEEMPRRDSRISVWEPLAGNQDCAAEQTRRTVDVMSYGGAAGSQPRVCKRTAR